MKRQLRKILSLILVTLMLITSVPMSTLAADDDVKVTIVSFMRGEVTDIRSSELLEARVTGYSGNVRELKYKWTSTLGTYLYIYNSHNMYNINNTDGEQEIYNNSVKTSENMAGRSHKDTFTGVGYAWAAVYGANLSGSSLAGTITVEVYDANGKLLGSDTHVGKYSNRKNTGILTYDFAKDMDNVVIGLFEGDTRNVIDLLGESAIVHITCVESSVSKGKVISGGEHISLTQPDDYYITGVKAGTSTDSDGDAKVDLTITKGNCKFHNKKTATATTTVFVFKKPKTSTTTTTLTLAADSIDTRCRYFIGGVEGTKQGDGSIIFTGLTPNTSYTVEVQAEYKDNDNNTKYAYAYVYDTTKPVYQATVKTYLDKELTDISAIHGEDVTLYLLEQDTNENVSLTHTATGTYTATVENGIYYPWHIEAGDHEHMAREYKLIIENANGELALHHYSVTYDTNGGAFNAGDEVTKEIYSSMSAVKATANKPVREGYAFAGWEYNGATYDSGAEVTSAISAPITLKAKWEKEVNVTINVTIDHKVDGGFDVSENKDELTVNFLEMKSGSPAFVETGDKLNFAKEGVTDEKGNTKAYEYSTYTLGDEILETKYTATAATYSGLLESSTFGVALSKSGYDVGTIEKIQDANGNWTINIPLTYNPNDFDLEFSVEMADDVPVELYPDAVIVKIACWDAVAGEWVIITQQRTTENTVRPGVRVNIDKTTGEGSGSYPVWRNDGHGNEYGYRAVVTGFIYKDSTIVVPTYKDHFKGDQDVIMTYTDGNYTATMSDVKDGKKFSTSLYGAYYNDAINDQQGTLHGVISVEKYDVTFDAQGGTIKDEATYTEKNQYYIPALDNYIPVMEGHNFQGWYLDKECTIIATEGVLLTKDVTLYAEWDRVLTGTIIVDGYYMDDDNNQIPVSDADRAKHALIELEEITPDGVYDIAGQTVEISWPEDEHYSNPCSYKFTGLDPDKTYRINVYLANYNAAYQNSTTVINGDGDIHDDYNETDYTAVYPADSKWETFVNTFMHFEPESYKQLVDVDTTLIGDGFRPDSALVEYLSEEVGVDDDYVLIVQHKVDPYGVAVGLKADGTNNGEYGETIWKKNFNGNLYDYQANLTKLGGKDLAEWPVIVVYGDPVRWSPVNQAPTANLKVTVMPRWYSITYDFGYEVDGEAYKEVNAYGHIWSFETAVDYVPERLGYNFKGWYTNPECEGEAVTKIDAAVHEDTVLYAKWEKRTDCGLTIYHEVEGTGYHLGTDIISSGFGPGDVVGIEEIEKGSFKGYTYVSASADGVVIDEDATKNSITLYYTANSYPYTFEFREKDTNEVLASAITGIANYGDIKTAIAMHIDGYTAIDADKAIVIDVENNVAVFYYTKNSYGYSVNYLEEGTNKVLAAPKSGEALYKSTVEATAETIKGYTLVGADKKSIKIDIANNVINFYYTVNNYGYTVNYLENGTGKALATAKTVENIPYGTLVTENAAAISGYTPVGDINKSIKIDTENNIINFYYDINSYYYTVKYLEYGTNEPLASDKTATAIFGTTVTETAEKIVGYETYGATYKSIVIDVVNNEIVFYYTISKYDYTVNYLEKGTNKVLTISKTANVSHGTNVTENAEAITGYTVDGAATQSMVIDGANKVINFYYTADNYGYTVNYLEKGTDKVLATAKTATGTFGTTVTENAIAIKGYTVDGAATQTITIDVENNVINFYYTADSYEYIVEYYKQTVNGTYELDCSKNIEADLGDYVTADKENYDGYCFNEAKSNISGTIEDGKTLRLKLYYDIDVIGGGENGDEGDGIPDDIQKKVIFKVVGGTWADGTTKDIIEFVTLTDGTGKFDAPEGMIADAENSEGAWYDAGNKYLGNNINETVSGINTVTYTYKFVEVTIPDTPDVPEGDLDSDGDVDADDIYGDDDSAQAIVFGKTDAIGWYSVSLDGGQTYQIVFGNSTLEVERGTEIIVKAGDLVGGAFTFYVNGDAVKPDENGEIRVLVDGYILIGALSIDVEVPDVEESLNWFQRIIKAIKDFFAKIFGKKK